MTKPRSAAPDADTTGLSTETKAALASILTDTTPPANASNDQTIELLPGEYLCNDCGLIYWQPHPTWLPEETARHHIICEHCTDRLPDALLAAFRDPSAPAYEWNALQAPGMDGWFKHLGTARHQLYGEWANVTMAYLLEKLPPALRAAKTHQKLMQNPAYTPLRRLFR